MVSEVAGLLHSALPKAVGGALDGPALPVANACALQLLVEVVAGAPVWAGQALVQESTCHPSQAVLCQNVRAPKAQQQT